MRKRFVMRKIVNGVAAGLLAIGFMVAGTTSASAAPPEVGDVAFDTFTPGMVVKSIWNGSSWTPVACYPSSVE